MKKMIYLFMALMILVSVSAITYQGTSYPNLVFFDDFEYTDTFTSRNWSVNELQTCLFPQKPYSVGGDLSLGWNNATSICPEFALMEFSRTNSFTETFSSDNRLIFRTDLYIGANMNFSTTRNLITLRCNGNDNALQINTPSNFSKIIMINGRTGGASCVNSAQLIKGGLNEIRFDMDFGTNIYSLYVNDDSSGCSFETLGTDSGNECVNGIFIQAFGGSAGASGVVHYGFQFIDAYSVLSNINVTGAIGDPCTNSNNSQCTYGRCAISTCVLIEGGGVCDELKDCQSGRCVNSICTRPSASQKMKNLITLYFGDDQASLIFLGLVFVVVLSLLGLALSKSVIGGILGLVLGLISATIFGFVPLFVIIILVLVIAIMGFVGFLVSHKGG